MPTNGVYSTTVSTFIFLSVFTFNINTENRVTQNINMLKQKSLVLNFSSRIFIISI